MCASWCCSCANRDVHTLPKRALQMRGPNCLASSCTASGYPAFVLKMEVSQCESAENADAEQLATAQLGVEEGVCLLRQRLIIWLQTVSGRSPTELRRVLKSALHCAEPLLLPGVTLFGPESVYWNT